jgi:DNA-binding XRE family transcriptional regulator
MNTKLKGKRVEKGFNQTELANKLGISLSSYCQKEIGKVDFTLTEIQDLMYYLNCDFDDIFFRKEVANNCDENK